MKRTGHFRGASLALILSFPASVSGCPLCHTRAGEQVRAAIFGAFLHNAAVALAPFPIFALLVAFVYFRFPGAGRS